MRRKYYLVPVIMVILAVAVSLQSNAQNTAVLTAEAFIQQVKRNHPLANLANLVTEKAAADLLAAKGAFDPLLDASGNYKAFDGIDYYRYTNSELKIPTGTAINLKAGFENSSGQYRNPELTSGVASYLGIELPLLNGLLTDKKRTVLQQAKIYRAQSEQERMLKINDLLVNAYDAYWDWAGAYQLYQVYNNFLDVAERRSRLVVLAYNNGDRAMADTIEGYAQVQNFRLLQSAALLDLNKKTIELSYYLWSEKGEPYLLPAGFVPDTVQLSQWQVMPDAGDMIGQVPLMHPALQAGQYKLRILDLERKYKLQNLLPVVDLRGNILSRDYFQFKNISAFSLDNNYKFGINVQVPLLLRQARGEYRYSRLKLKEANLELEAKTWDIINKVKQYAAELDQLQQQLKTAYEMNRAYKALLQAEQLKFSQGESSLFLVNVRENKALEIAQKIIELQVKYRKAGNAMQWAGGVLHRNVP